MGKFKEFLLNEEIGLGNLGKSIEKFYTDSELQNKINGAFVSSYWNDSFQNHRRSETMDQNLKIPTDLTIPCIEKSGRIISIDKKQNPIMIKLSDGTQCLFTNREFRNITGNPTVGKLMTVRFQRSPQDITHNYSKIEKVIVNY